MTVGLVLSLAAAAGYGASDFLAGVAGRHGKASTVALLGQPFGLSAAVLGLWLIPWSGPTPSSLAWGALSGIGGGLGILALYRALRVGRMSVVAPVAGILTAVIPAVVGLALGNRPGAAALVGIVLAMPAVALISLQRGGASDRGSGVPEALVAGACFALLFIGLDRAGTSSGTWPLVSAQSVSVIVVAVAAVRVRDVRPNWVRMAPLAIGAGLLGGVGNILFLSATGRGELAVVAVISSLYPAMTVLLARVFLRERFTGVQKLGLAVAVVAVALISL
jgi:drug/metabolite transporter (DMT)-like permease